MSNTGDDAIKKIVSLFNSSVKGKKIDTTLSNIGHDGKEGHWLETQMGISHNASNTPDLFGYEMKNGSKTKTSFGDWSADYYIFRDKKYGITRDEFIKIFGHPNPKKDGRYSWSGQPIPKIDVYNKFGQILLIDKYENIVIEYSYSKDVRENKSEIVPKAIRQENLTIVRWDKESMKQKLEDKFNQLGWFKCLKDKSGIYNEIVFGLPITWEIWMADVKTGQVFFDSGLHVGNSRLYSQWRANNKYWTNKIISRY